MVPFKVGDHLTFSDRKVSTEIICFEIVVENVQVRTRPTQSSFIRVEDAIIGVFTTNANAEMAGTRTVGYFSDAAATASIYTPDVDPCTGGMLFSYLTRSRMSADISQRRPKDLLVMQVSATTISGTNGCGEPTQQPPTNASQNPMAAKHP